MSSFMLLPMGLAVVALQGCNPSPSPSPSPQPDPVPKMMVAIQALNAPCEAPDWTCLQQHTVSVPTPAAGQALLEMRGTSANPVNLDFVEPNHCEYFGCPNGTIGQAGDVSGIIVGLGPMCEGLKMGDEVWGNVNGSYAQYAVGNCSQLGLKPKSMSFADAATLPVVGGTSLQCLQRAGLPSKNADLTVVVTSGQGGTGFVAIQLAKALGAAQVITAATGAGIELTKSLGADIVVDYHKEGIFETLMNNTVDIVFDNLGHPGTADKAMHAIKPGGTYLLLLGSDGGSISDQPKDGVRQIPFGFFDPARATFDELAGYVDAGDIQAHIFETYGLADTAAAWTRLAGHGVLGKIAVDPTNLTGVSSLQVV